jgi:predicted phosphodiesterase
LAHVAGRWVSHPLLEDGVRISADAVVCAGDIVDGAPFPEETIALLRERRVPCIRGNHDRWAIGRGSAATPGEADDDAAPYDASGFGLSDDAVAFLAALPTAWDATIDGVRVAVRHGTPRSDMDGIYPDQASAGDIERWLAETRADVLVVGHTHLAFELSAFGHRGVVVNPGALYRGANDGVAGASAWLLDPERGTFAPGPPPGGGTFGVLDLPSMRFTVHRAADGAVVAHEIRVAGVEDRRGA